MKNNNGLISKIKNLNFTFASYVERVRDNVRTKFRTIKVRMKKKAWVRKLYAQYRKVKYVWKHTKLYIGVCNLADKLMTENVRKTLWAIKRSGGYRFVSRFGVIVIAVAIALGIMNKDDYSSASVYEEEQNYVTHAGTVTEESDPEPTVSSEPIPDVEATKEPAGEELEGGNYVSFIPTEDNTKWLKDARVNNYDDSKYIDYKGYKLYKDANIKRSYIGVDVSVYQGDINWAKVKAAGVTYAMIRVGIRGYVSGKIQFDEKFKQNILGASKYGIKVGVYFFSSAINEKEAIQEANFVINAIKNYNITMPVAYDGEFVPDSKARTNRAKLNNQQRTDIAIAFLDTIKNAGYLPMIYDNHSHLTGGLQLSRLNDYYVWYARYAEKPSYKYGYEMWQYTEKGKVPGISSGVDLNVCMMNFPAISYLKKQNQVQMQ